MKQIAWAVEWVARFVPKASCLTQAVSLQRMLAVRGQESAIHVGVRRNGDGGFAAHAWLVVGEQIVIGATQEDVTTFSPLMRLNVEDQ